MVGGLAIAREDSRARAREVETRHDVGYDHHFVAVEAADAPLAVGGVGEREDRVGVGVVDELVGQDRMQDRFDRRRGRIGAQHVGAHLVHHLRVGKRFELRERHQVVQAHRRKARRLDRLEVPAAALHVEDGLLAPEEVLLVDLHRRVAAAVQHQGLVAPQQARGVHAQSQLARELRRLAVVPQAFHRVDDTCCAL